MVLMVEPPSSNPPVGGSQHPQPLHTPLSSEPELRVEEDEPTSSTKSPETQRVLKRARFTSPGPEAHVDAPFLVSTTPPLSLFLSTQQPPTLRTPEETAPPTLPPPAMSCDVPADYLRHLESLVDSVLATVVIIQAATSQPVVLSPHMQRALELLNKFVAPNSATTRSASQPKTWGPTTPSYAQATTRTHSTPTVEKTIRLSLATHTRTSPKTLCLTRHSPHRLIVCWAGHPIPSTSIALDQFVQDLDMLVCGGLRHGSSRREHPSRITGANITKTGNLVIHTTAPFTATQLWQYREEIKQSASAIPGFDPPVTCTPELELDIPWHGIVIHGLPAVSLLAAYEGDRGDDGEALRLWEALERETGIPQADIRDIQVLCRDEEQGKQERLSL